MCGTNETAEAAARAFEFLDAQPRMAARGSPLSSLASALHKSKRGSWMHDDHENDRFQGACGAPALPLSLFNALRR